MKKFMFSAVALVTFSFAGMANTNIEVSLDIKTVSVLNIYSDVDCFSWATGYMDALEAWEPEAIESEADYTYMLNNAIATCEGYDINVNIN